MKYKIIFSYETEGTEHKGEYITDNPAECNEPMRKVYGDTFQCKITGVKE